MSASRGFTLIEVLVALAIVAIGMAAVIGTVGSSADTAAYLRDKTFAQWIAFNQLAQVRLTPQLPSKGTTEGELDYAGHHWRWQQDVGDTSFPGMLRIDVKVQQADTPKGKDAPWIGNITGAIGDALAPQSLVSAYQEYLPPGTPNPNGTNPAGTVPPNGVPQPNLTPQPNGAPGTQPGIGTQPNVTPQPNTGASGPGEQ